MSAMEVIIALGLVTEVTQALITAGAVNDANDAQRLLSSIQVNNSTVQSIISSIINGISAGDMTTGANKRAKVNVAKIKALLNQYSNKLASLTTQFEGVVNEQIQDDNSHSWVEDALDFGENVLKSIAKRPDPDTRGSNKRNRDARRAERDQRKLDIQRKIDNTRSSFENEITKIPGGDKYVQELQK